jgi:PAS domain-containing protein
MKLKFNLSHQISIGYLVILVVAIAAVLSCFLALRKNAELDNQIDQVYTPLFASLKELSTLQNNSVRLTNRWIHNPAERQEKKDQEVIYRTRYQELKQELTEVLENLPQQSEKKSILNMLEEFQLILMEETKLMNTLKNDSSYAGGELLNSAIRRWDRVVVPQTKDFKIKLDARVKLLYTKIETARSDKQHSNNIITFVLVIMLVLFIGTSAIAYFLSVTRLVKPIIQLKDVIREIGEGSMVKATFEKRKDEIGQITQALTNLMDGINGKLIFAEQIGKGEYTADFQLLSERDAMGKALLEMRDNLKHNTEVERQRNWAVTGLAEFADIIRNQNDLQMLGDAIIRNIVKYTNSNQGSLFIISDDGEESEVYLKLQACYAWDKKKFEEKIIYRGQGLIGQCWEEREPIFMKQVPDNYVNITSGLGYATPRSIFIVPLKVNESVYGVLELASFEPYQKYKMEFIVKVCENIASAISSARNSEQTNRLLSLSRQQTENLHAQEEEMRQNMEELAATQEEMQRVLIETQNKERYLRDMMNASTDSILTFNAEYKVLNYNTVAQKSFQAGGSKLEVNADLLKLASSSGREIKPIYDRALAGETVQLETEYSGMHFSIQHVPMRNDRGEVFAVAIFAKDVTSIKKAKLEVDRLLAESQAQEEELRQTMEELQATSESEAKRARELERTSGQLDAQKQMMFRTIEKLKEKEKESLAQEEELRQAMEELQATMESESRRNKELERSASQMEAQKQMMLKTIEKLKEKESETRAQSEQIKQKEEQLLAQEQVLRQMMEELGTSPEAKK